MRPIHIQVNRTLQLLLLFFLSLDPIFFSFLFLRFCLFIHRDRERERERQRHRQREKQASYREPDVGSDPGPPGSRPGLQVVLNRCATGAALIVVLICISLMISYVEHIFMCLLAIYLYVFFRKMRI